MHPTAESIIEDIDRSVYEQVARNVVGDSSARLADEPRWSEIDASHGDFRTLAILRVEGTASVGTRQIPWSSVQKLVDTGIEGGHAAASWVDPNREQAVYESGLFKDAELKFRPVDCYHITESGPDVKMYWLEDLTEADRTPFSVEQLHQILGDIGEFNGYYGGHDVGDQLKVATNSYLLRWNGMGWAEGIERVEELTDRPEIRRVLRSTTFETVRKLYRMLDQLNRQSQKLDRTLSFGDCNTGNLFRIDDRTVAIDWATVTMDPTGVDAGSVIGSAMVWSGDGRSVLEAEVNLFSSYLDGLCSGGWTGEVDHVRQGYFGQLGVYLMTPIAGWHRVLGESADAEFWRVWLEKRFQTPFDKIPDLLAPIVDSYPRYIEEISKMLESN